MENQKTKISLEDFGAKIRTKYPAYARFSNKEIAEKTIAKYPQYRDVISDLPAQEEQPGFLARAGRFVADAFTGSTQKLGATLGQIAASEEVNRGIGATEQLASDTQLALQRRIRENKIAGKDTTRLETELARISGRPSVATQIQETIPSTTLSNRQVGGQILGTATEALSGGVLSGIRGAGLARVAPTAAAAATSRAQFLAKPLLGRVGDIGVGALKTAAQAVPFGYAFDVARNLEEDETGASLFKPGAATLVSAAIPLSFGAVQAARQATASALTNVVAPNLSDVSSGAFDRLRTGNVTRFLGKTNPDQALNDARAAASAFKSTMYDEFGRGKEEIITKFTGQRIGIDDNAAGKLQKISERFGFYERLPQNLKNMSPKEVMDLLENINSVPAVKEIDDPLVRSLKFNLMEVKDDIMSRAKAEFGGEGGDFEKLYQNYAQKKGKLRDFQAILGKVGVNANSQKLTPVQQKTAAGRLMRVFNEDADGYYNAIKTLEEETGQPILDKIAAAQLSPALPKSVRGGAVSSFRADGLLGIVGDAFKLLTLPLSSPRSASFIIRKVGGFDDSIVTKILNASPSVRNAIYNAVHKENMSFNDAVELYAKDFIRNPRLGASVQQKR